VALLGGDRNGIFTETFMILGSDTEHTFGKSPRTSRTLSRFFEASRDWPPHKPTMEATISKDIPLPHE
jgi:hypothetical protein